MHDDTPALHHTLRALAIFLLAAMAVAFVTACSVIYMSGSPPPRMLLIQAAPPICLWNCDATAEVINDEGSGAVTGGALTTSRTSATTQTSVERTNSPPPPAAKEGE